MSIEEKFKKAVDDVRKLKSLPSNDDLLEIYALFKQATVGDNTTEKPGLLDLKAKAKWEAWSAKKGLPKDKVKEQYITKVNYLISTIGFQ